MATSQGWALLQGKIMALSDASIPITDVAVTLGWSVFETMRVVGGRVPLLSRHLFRLQNSARAARVPDFSVDELRDEIEALARLQHGLGRLRISLSASGLRFATVVDLDPARHGAPVVCVRGPFRPDPILGGAVKHASRAPWVVAVLRAGVDDVMMVDSDGRFTEATTAAIVAVKAGALWTAASDGRILPSTTIDVLLEDAAALGIEVHRQGVLADDTQIDALYLASATRWLAPVISLDGVAYPPTDQIGSALLARDAARLLR